MKLLENKTNVTAPDADYPFGVTRDKTPSLPGTIWNQEMMGDIVQFASKMFNESGLTANGLPDNESNGWQLYEALKGIFGGLRRKVVNIGDWDMDADTTTSVAHGIADFTKVRGINVLIIRDDEAYNSPLAGPYGAVAGIDATNVELLRVASGFFDSTNYDSTSFNRGYIVIDYVE